MWNLKKDMLECFKTLSKEARELYLRENVAEIEPPISPLHFYREWVGPNLPVLIKGAVKHWSAVKKWCPGYFQQILGTKAVTVAVTPNGYADAVAVKNDCSSQKEYFVMPEERTMTIQEFFHALDDQEKYRGVYYIQQQNSNLTHDFPELLHDCDTHVPWASEAFGSMPDAVNLWIGDGRAITSMHKDPYENIYCVVSGCKDFILLPPTDRPWIPYRLFRTAVYKENTSSGFDIIPTSEDDEDDTTEDSSQNVFDSISGDALLYNPEDSKRTSSCVPWICIDPLQPDLERYPLYKNANPVKVSVEEGDALYLPSLWYHHVQQSHGCIAVNYWYNMQFDIKYAYHQMLEMLTSKCMAT